MYKKLRQLREGQRVSQEKMGRLLSISQPQYQRKESGIVPFTEEECQILADYFNVPIAEIEEHNGHDHLNHQIKGDISAIYGITSQLMDEVREMNSFLLGELVEKKQEILDLKKQIEILQNR